jgi:hypothetical protein
MRPLLTRFALALSDLRGQPAEVWFAETCAHRENPRQLVASRITPGQSTAGARIRTSGKGDMEWRSDTEKEAAYR